LAPAAARHFSAGLPALAEAGVEAPPDGAPPHPKATSEPKKTAQDVLMNATVSLFFAARNRRPQGGAKSPTDGSSRRLHPKMRRVFRECCIDNSTDDNANPAIALIAILEKSSFDVWSQA
jgi:hypothetical protein